MSVSRPTQTSGDGRLWAASFVVSLLLNALIFGSVAKIATETAKDQARLLANAQPTTEERWVAAVIPEHGPAASVTTSPTPPAARLTPFARTSPEQESERPAAARFMGERNTAATSDRAPESEAPPLPSQAGVDDDKREMETTDSRYRDGEMDGGKEAAPNAQQPPAAPSQPASATEAKPPGEKTDTPGNDSQTSPPPARERLAEGPTPVDREVAVTKGKSSESPKPTPPQQAPAGVATEQASTLPKATPEPVSTTPVKPSKPGFSGNQRKTQIRGSISRRGVSALDVEDSPLGRYQATISRAVEREWQRNCTRYRDLITPGFLTVRFVVESTGKVRSVNFVESADSGEVQKGFTINSIREAEIPAMPAELKKQLGGEPLELLFNFYF